MRLSFRTVLGIITLESHEGCITSLSFRETEQRDESPVLLDAEQEIAEYLKGERKKFTVPVCPRGTEYQKRVWDAASKIPYGETRTYSWVAGIAGGSPRSAGNALGANPIPIIIPCHRIVSSDGGISGYSSGIDIKRSLLRLERLHLDESVLK